MMHADTGRLVPTLEHIRQSVRNILFTRIGTRVEREEYGSLLPDLIDMPQTPVTMMMCRAAVVSALARWEPRIRITAVETAPAPASARLLIRIRAELADKTPALIEVAA